MEIMLTLQFKDQLIGINKVDSAYAAGRISTTEVSKAFLILFLV